MGTFVLTVFTANATGPLCAAWIAQKLNWHWVYWIQMSAFFLRPSLPSKGLLTAGRLYSVWCSLLLLVPGELVFSDWMPRRRR